MTDMMKSDDPQNTGKQDTSKLLPQVDATEDKSALPVYPGSAQLGTYQPVPAAGSYQPVQGSYVEVVTNQPSTHQHQYYGPKPYSFNEVSICILATTCICCSFLTLPFALVAVYFSYESSAAWERGDVEKARTNSRCAGGWSLVAAIGLIVMIIFSVVITALRINNANNNQP